MLIVSVLHEYTLFPGSHCNYRNQLGSRIHNAPCRDWLHLAGINRNVFPLTVALLTDHHCDFALYSGFVPMRFALRQANRLVLAFADFPNRVLDRIHCFAHLQSFKRSDFCCVFIE